MAERNEPPRPIEAVPAFLWGTGRSLSTADTQSKALVRTVLSPFCMTPFSWLAIAAIASLTFAVRCRDNPTPIPEVPPKPPAGSISAF